MSIGAPGASRPLLTLPHCFLLTAEGRRDVPQPETVVLREPGTLNDYTEHICRLEISQVKLVIYRVSLCALTILYAGIVFFN